MDVPPLTQARPQLTYDAAMIAIAAAVAKAREIWVPECIAVVDAGPNLLVYSRLDGAAVLAHDLAVSKANTAASLRIETGSISYEFGVELASTSHGAITNIGGGLPIIVRGMVLGAIGVSSGTVEQDLAVAEAGRSAVLVAMGQPVGRSA